MLQIEEASLMNFFLVSVCVCVCIYIYIYIYIYTNVYICIIMP